MVEAWSGQVPASVEEAEDKGNRKIKIITAGAIGALSLTAAYAESRGWANGFPPTAHSLKHPALGYYGAWAAARLYGRRKNTASFTGGIAGDFLGESAQDLANRPDHHPFHWANLADGAHSGENIGNLIDLAAAMGGMALYMAQNNQTAAWVKAKLFKTRGKRPRANVSPSPVLAPVKVYDSTMS